MFAHAISIGESECSQDTPMRNTTPLKKRPCSKVAKRVKQPKLNQCQTVFKIIATSRSMEDKFDPNFDAIDKDLNDMETVLDDMNEELDNASIRKAGEENGELLLLIQEFAEKYTAIKESDHMPDYDMPDYNPFQDVPIIRECVEAHKERSAAVQSAHENNERVKQQLEDFKENLQQVRADVAAKIHEVREEYEARLSQQRKELDEKYKQKKADLVQKLSEQTAEPSRPHQVEVDKATADRELERLQFRLRETELDLRETRLTLERKFEKERDSKGPLWDSLHTYVTKNTRLRSEVEKKQEVIEKLQGAHKEQIVNLSDEHQRQLQAAQSSFHLREEKMRADFKINQDRYAQASGHETFLLQMRLNAEKASQYELSRKEIQTEREYAERRLRDLKMELTAQRKAELQEQRDSDHGQHALERIHMKQTWRRKLKEQLTTEWSCKLTDAENLLASEHSAAAQLRYNLSLTDIDLKAKVLEVTSQMERIQTLEETNGNLSQDKRKTEKAVNDLQNKLDNANDKIDDLEGKLEAGNEKLSTATEETMDARRRLERSANRTASLELLLGDAKRTTDTLSTDLRNERERLEKERLSNASLKGCIRRLEQEKENSDKRNKELDLLLLSTKDNVKNLEADALFYDAERACILQQLMAESTRLHCMEGKLPQDLARIPGDVHDVQMFSGVQAGETVLVRAQMFRGARKAFIIVQRHDRTRTVWHGDLERCTVNMVGWREYLRLENGSEEAPMEICIADPLDLEGWLKVSAMQ